MADDRMQPLPPEGWARVAVTTYREFKADRILAEQNFDSTDDDWRGALERNLIQTVRMMRRALPHMNGRPGAAVINVASISGWSPQLAMSGQYGAAKAARAQSARGLAIAGLGVCEIVFLPTRVAAFSPFG